ncbi:hypothetical protein C8T65DRAFT_698871 [Cerioporus squamosus]|nr:hypothetical protein C8T65DRAFT_698871 [Cerioporus squamosus]
MVARTRSSRARKDDDGTDSVMSLSDQEPSSPAGQRHRTRDEASEDDAGIPQELSHHARSDDFDASSTVFDDSELDSDQPVPEPLEAGSTDAEPGDFGAAHSDGESEVAEREMDSGTGSTDGDSDCDELPTGSKLLKIVLPGRTPKSEPSKPKPSSSKTKLNTAKVTKGKKPQIRTSPSAACSGKSTRQQAVLESAKKAKKKGPELKGSSKQLDKPGPGRPPKTEEVPPPITQWSVSAYLEIEQPPQLVQKTQRSMKRLEQQEPLRLGPLTITHETTWTRLLKHVAKELQVSKENVPLHSFRWRSMPETGSKRASADMWLPMSNASGYDEFVKTGIKKLRCSRFLLRMSPPQQPEVQKAGPSGRSINQSDQDDSDDDAPKVKKKKVSPKKMSIDALLNDKIDALKEKHKVGKCGEHPGIRCYRDAAGLHFELDNNRLMAWAHAIHMHEDGVDMTHAPTSNIFFKADRAIKPRRGQRGMESQFNAAMAPYGYQQHWAAHPGYAPPMYYPPMMGAPSPYGTFPPPPSPYGYQAPMYGAPPPIPMGLPPPPPAYPPQPAPAYPPHPDQ